MLDAIAEKYNRPHRKTNALLAGLMYYLHCGKRLRVISESDRWTNGKPRFKYVCPDVRKGKCIFKAVEGISLDEYVVKQLSDLSSQQSKYYQRIFEAKLDRLIVSDQSEQEYRNTKEAINRLQTAISAQVRNMREAPESLRKYIEADIQEMTAELEKKQANLHRMDEIQAGSQFAFHELSVIKKRLLSFAEYAKDAQPEALVTLINTVVERTYVTTENDKLICQIFIKGCSTEDYSRLFGAAEYIRHNAVQPIDGVVKTCDLEPYSICTEIQKVNNLLKNKGGYRIYIEGIMQVERNRNNRGKGIPGSHPYAVEYTPEICSGR